MRRPPHGLELVIMAAIGLPALLLTAAGVGLIAQGFASLKPGPVDGPGDSLVIVSATPPTNMVVTEVQAAAADPLANADLARAAAHQPAADVAMTGEALFKLRCAPCHGLNGEGFIGPAFNDRPVLPAEFVLNRVRTGPEVMSAFTVEELPDDQVARIVEYLQTTIVNTAVPAYTEAELAQGKALYQEYCVECHSVFGQGKENLGPAINRWPPLGISRIVEGGLLPLPDMLRLPVTPDELRLIAGHVQSLAFPK